MTELKFKLKKAGTCVGYMRITRRQSIQWLCIRYRETEDHKWFTIGDGDLPVFDSIHPFVCQDRNGEDVYEGDTVKTLGRGTGRVEFGRVLMGGTGRAYVGFYIRIDGDHYTNLDGTLEVVEMQDPEGLK